MVLRLHRLQAITKLRVEGGAVPLLLQTVVMQRFFILVPILLLLKFGTAFAGWFGADFSADLVQRQIDGRVMAYGKIYVSKGRVRTEIKKGTKRQIEIIDPNQKRAWMLDTIARQYQERAVPHVMSGTEKGDSPCTGVTKLSCQRVAEEIVNGRRAVHWKVKGETASQQQWNDAEHGFPVQVIEQGQLLMSMRFIGKDTIDGRQVELWHVQRRHNGNLLKSRQWYDPQLNIALRQLSSSEGLQELKNIRVGEQEEKLFQLPAGYRLVVDLKP